MLLIAKYRPFVCAFLVVVIAFAIAFVLDYRSKFDGLCMDCDNDFGWPFKVYQSGSLIHATKTLWLGVIANLLTVVISGTVVGAICQFTMFRKSEWHGSKMR